MPPDFSLFIQGSCCIICCELTWEFVEISHFISSCTCRRFSPSRGWNYGICSPWASESYELWVSIVNWWLGMDVFGEGYFWSSFLADYVKIFIAYSLPSYDMEVVTLDPFSFCSSGDFCDLIKFLFYPFGLLGCVMESYLPFSSIVDC